MSCRSANYTGHSETARMADLESMDTNLWNMDSDFASRAGDPQ
jgi:hypothetical protein